MDWYEDSPSESLHIIATSDHDAWKPRKSIRCFDSLSERRSEANGTGVAHPTGGITKCAAKSETYGAHDIPQGHSSGGRLMSLVAG